MALFNEQNNPYDEVPYNSHPFAQTHPDKLASLARIFGLFPPPITECRVLELGCASGGNLIPLAFNLPNSTFIGVDLSRHQVETGRETIKAIGLENIRIQHASILDIDDSWGQFDYIICHGVFAWVESKVQDKILAIAANNLSPQGIAYISYNTYPGWHMRGAIRHMMCYHVDQFDKPSERTEQARALLDFLAAAVPKESSAYGQFLHNELTLLRKCHDSYIYHEHLEAINAPLYFHQFIERAELAGLQYLAEADFSTMLTARFDPAVAQTLEQISPNIIQLEQYMDFVRNRLFRQTLLCHKNLKLNRALTPAVMESLLVASEAKPDIPIIDLSSETSITFRLSNGSQVETAIPIVKAALLILYEHWPCAMSVTSLCNKALALISETDPANAESCHRQLMQELFQLFVSNVIEVHSWQSTCVLVVSERPKVHPLAAYQAEVSDWVVNMRHEHIPLDVFTKALIPLLDGSLDHGQLLDSMVQKAQGSVIQITINDEPVFEESRLREVISELIVKSLGKFAKAGLLVG